MDISAAWPCLLRIQACFFYNDIMNASEGVKYLDANLILVFFCYRGRFLTKCDNVIHQSDI